MNILFIGDIFGKAGRKILQDNLAKLKEQYKIDFTIANAENCSHGKGLTKEHYSELKRSGIDFFSMGNHTWAKREIIEFINNTDLVRPLNMNDNFEYCNLGEGSREIVINDKKIRITNLLGLSVTNMLPILSNPFIELQKIIDKTEKDVIHIVDFHAETTSEKNAFGIYFDGKVHAILGTHTHIPTNDLRISPKGTIYITDVGMCGPGFGSVIGAKAENAIARFLDPEVRFKLEVSDFGSQLNAVVMEFDNATNLPTGCKQIRIVNDDPQYLNWTYQFDK